MKPAADRTIQIMRNLRVRTSALYLIYYPGDTRPSRRAAASHYKSAAPAHANVDFATNPFVCA